MENQGQFQIVVLEGESETASHSLAGPFGMGITSSIPAGNTGYIVSNEILIQILPRPNEQEVDPSTLKSS